MTVITMPTSEKKSDNVPLVTNIEIDPAAQEKGPEPGNGVHSRSVRSKLLVLRVINDRVYSMWALIYVLLMSLVITFMMLYGEYIYRAIGNAFNDETDAFYGTGTIALNDKLTLQDMNNDYEMREFKENSEFNRLENMARNMDTMNNQFMDREDIISQFNEDFELGLKDDSYEKISPILPLANSARFIHDFSSNVTGIVDVDAKRCFIMPLNRSAVLPPKSLYDLLFKMSSGYYAVDTRNVMHNMRVVKPAVQDLTEYGIYIAKDCAGFPTYKLEKIVSGDILLAFWNLKEMWKFNKDTTLFKRSVSTHTKTFSAFSGQMDSFHIVNYEEINSQ